MPAEPADFDVPREQGIAVYLAVAFGLAWLVQIPLAVVVRQASRESLASLTCLLLIPGLVAMWAPALGAYVARRRVERSGFADAGLRGAPWRYVVLAWLVPPLLTLMTLLLSLPIYPFDPSFRHLREMAEQSGQPLTMPPDVLIAHSIFLALTIGTLLHTVETFGEELGWRGYLLPRLMQLLGAWPGLLLHGAIWGLWHAPGVLLLGQNYPRHPLLGVLLMVAACTLLGVLLAWLQFASGSVLAPTVAHSAINNTAGLPMLLLPDVDTVVAGTIMSPMGWGVLLLAIAGLQVSGVLPRAVQSWRDHLDEQASAVGGQAAEEADGAGDEGTDGRTA